MKMIGQPIWEKRRLTIGRYNAEGQVSYAAGLSIASLMPTPFNLAMSALYVYDLCDHGKRTTQIQKAAHSLLWSWDKKRNR